MHLHLINRSFLSNGVFISKKVSKFSAPFNKLFTFDIDVINCYFPTFNRPFVATIFMNFPFAMTIQLKPRIELEKFRLATTTHFLIDISSPHLFVMYLSFIATLSCFFSSQNCRCQKQSSCSFIDNILQFSMLARGKSPKK